MPFGSLFLGSARGSALPGAAPGFGIILSNAMPRSTPVRHECHATVTIASSSAMASKFKSLTYPDCPALTENKQLCGTTSGVTKSPVALREVQLDTRFRPPAACGESSSDLSTAAVSSSFPSRSTCPRVFHLDQRAAHRLRCDIFVRCVIRAREEVVRSHASPPPPERGHAHRSSPRYRAGWNA